MQHEQKLDNDSVARYSRQLILPEIGVEGQIKLNNAKVLIVGAGGLGCPAAQYLASAGVGTIGIVDYDEVEVSNLHRQILHTEKRAADRWSKAESAAFALNELNSKCKIVPIIAQLDRNNALDIFKDYDVVIDATDNITSRYLISDTCVLTNKPLVSGGALRWEGQLTVYNYTDDNGTTGPCYRCLHPIPPPPESVTNCSDGGVIGVVPGIIGCMQALETLKIIVGIQPSYHRNLFVFNGLEGNCRTVKLRGRQPSCVCCGDNRSIKLDNLPDYTEFCGMGANDKCKMLHILNPDERITVKQYYELTKKSKKHILIDVRNPVELGICSLPESINIPIDKLKTLDACMVKSGNSRTFPEIDKLCNLITEYSVDNGTKTGDTDSDLPKLPVFVVCRMGNDSQKAVKILQKCLKCDSPVIFKDLKGGLMAWANQIDKSMAQY
ncbi:adenylyltransferase and sulfurtransferase MOCS3-like [Styela clava]